MTIFLARVRHGVSVPGVIAVAQRLPVAVAIDDIALIAECEFRRRHGDDTHLRGGVLDARFCVVVNAASASVAARSGNCSTVS